MVKVVCGQSRGQLEALHEKYARHHLKGLWQRGGGKTAG